MVTTTYRCEGCGVEFSVADDWNDELSCPVCLDSVARADDDVSADDWDDDEDDTEDEGEEDSGDGDDGEDNEAR